MATMNSSPRVNTYLCIQNVHRVSEKTNRRKSVDLGHVIQKYLASRQTVYIILTNKLKLKYNVTAGDIFNI